LVVEEFDAIRKLNCKINWVFHLISNVGSSQIVNEAVEVIGNKVGVGFVFLFISFTLLFVKPFRTKNFIIRIKGLFLLKL
jgi:hypothetical protein